MARTFTIVRTLGLGAHGSVHLAEVRDRDNYVQTLAIKRLNPACSSDEPLVARLREEARLLAQVHHDNIVPVHGVTTLEGGLAIQMEPVYGLDLSRLTERAVLPARVSTGIVVEIADALDAAWTAQPSGQAEPLRLAHGDIKPSHVMITPRGGVRLLDFGIAWANHEAAGPRPTDRYCAPERWTSGEGGHAADIFALGILFVELLTGRAAFEMRADPEAFAEDQADLLESIEHPELRELLGRMIAFDPAARPDAVDVVTTALQLLPRVPGSDLRTWASQHVAVEAPSVDRSLDSLPVMLEDASNPGLPVLTPVPPPARLAPRRPLGWTLATAGAAMLLGVTLAGAWMARPSPLAVAVAGSLASADLRAAVQPETSDIWSSAATDGPRVAVRFVVDPGLQVRTARGEVTGSLQELPLGRAVELLVTEGDETWSCWITVSEASREVRVMPAAMGGCQE